MAEYGQDQIRPNINTRVYAGQRKNDKGDPYNPLPPVGGWGKPIKNVFKKYAKGKDGKYKAKDEKKKEMAEKMSEYTMGSWKKVKGKWKKLRDFGDAPVTSGPQKAASSGQSVDVSKWMRKDWPKKK